MKQLLTFLKTKYLFLLIAVQPVLDAVAYWMQSEKGTLAGLIRLGIMLLLPLVLLFRLEKKKGFLLAMTVMGLYSLLHIANGFRVGYINFIFDVAYLVRVLQMPVLAVCFVYMIRDKGTRKQAVDGMLAAAALCFLSLGLAIATGTDNVTYAEGMGISGWVIDDNRCANSIILVTMSCFAMYYGVNSSRRWVNACLPAL